MKASAMAAGAGAIGLSNTTFVAAEENSHYVVASDTHLGSPWANTDDFYQFLVEDVPELDPDVLVLAGDIYELWWRGLLSVALDFNAHSYQIEQLQESGTDVALVPGNHDRWLISPGRNARPEVQPTKPWLVDEEFRFRSGDTDFVAIHGDIVDPGQPVERSMWLSKQTDEFGSLLLTAYEDIFDRPAPSLGETGSQRVATDASWQTVSLDKTYENAVVIPVTVGTDQSVIPQIRTDPETAIETFDLRLGSVDAGAQPDGTVEYIAVEAGTHALAGGIRLTAAEVTADGSWTRVSFDSEFDERPVVLAAVQDAPDSVSDPDSSSVFGLPVELLDRLRERQEQYSQNGRQMPGRAGQALNDAEGDDVSPVAYTQVRNVTRRGFDIRVENAEQTHRVGYVAADEGWDVLGDSISPLDTGGTTTIEGDPQSALEDAWDEVIEASDGDAPDEPPIIAGLEPLFQTSSITNNALEKYDDFVVFGHTHSPDLGDRHVNSGHWTTRGSPSIENTFVEIRDGDITGWDWSPDGSEKLFES